MTDLDNGRLAGDLRAYLAHVSAEPMPRDLEDLAVEAPFVRQRRRSLWRGRLSGSLLVAAVATAAVIGIAVHLQRTATVPPHPAVPTANAPVIQSPTPSPTPAPSPSATPARPLPAVDVAGAKQSALALFVKHPLVLNDPQAGYIWSGGPSSASHESAKVKLRLTALGLTGFFSDAGKCGEDYISHSQNGLNSAPYVVSAVTGADGSVIVVMHRESRGTVHPNLTAVMTRENGAWLATDLASGTGPDASIFSANPNC